MEEEEKGGDDSQSNDYILPESFFVTQMTTKDSLLSPTDIFTFYMILMWPWISIYREICWG